MSESLVYDHARHFADASEAVHDALVGCGGHLDASADTVCLAPARIVDRALARRVDPILRVWREAVAIERAGNGVFAE